MYTKISKLVELGIIDGDNDLFNLKHNVEKRHDALIWKIIDKLANVFSYKNIHVLALDYYGDEIEEIICKFFWDSKIKDVRIYEKTLVIEVFNPEFLRVLIINSDFKIDAIEVSFSFDI